VRGSSRGGVFELGRVSEHWGSRTGFQPRLTSLFLALEVVQKRRLVLLGPIGMLKGKKSGVIRQGKTGKLRTLYLEKGEKKSYLLVKGLGSMEKSYLRWGMVGPLLNKDRQMVAS